MPKKGTVHPKYRKVKAVFPDGKYDMYTTYSKSDEVHFDIFFKKHPAWDKERKGAFINVKETAVTDFNKRYSGLDFLGSSPKDEA